MDESLTDPEIGVSHGCVRLHNDDIERLYQMARVGDEVIIY